METGWALRLDIPPLGEIQGMGGVLGVHQVSQAGRKHQGCGGMPFQDGKKSASGGPVKVCLVKLAYHLLKNGRGEGKGVLMPCLRGFWVRSGL